MKISIIVPVYNVEKYIKRCLDSIIGQTYKDWQLIIVNDGSIDHCPDICDAYAKCNDKVQVIHKKNGGQSDARNAGLVVATGEYIVFVDSDDWLEPTYLEELYNAIEGKDVDLAVCGYYHSTDKIDTPVRITAYDTMLNQKEFIHKLAMNDIQSFAWNKIYSAKLFERHAFREGVYYEDVILFNELIPEITKVVIINRPLYHYYMRENSTVHVRSLKREYDYFQAFKERYEMECIGESEKVIILKLLLISYYYIVQAGGEDFNVNNKYKNYIKIQKQEYIKKARNKLRFIERIRYGMSMYCPKIYQWIISKIKRLRCSN